MFPDGLDQLSANAKNLADKSDPPVRMRQKSYLLASAPLVGRGDDFARASNGIAKSLWRTSVARDSVNAAGMTSGAVACGYLGGSNPADWRARHMVSAPIGLIE